MRGLQGENPPHFRLRPVPIIGRPGAGDRSHPTRNSRQRRLQDEQQTLGTWRHLLVGSDHTVKFLTGRTCLQHFNEKQELQPWALYPENFDINIRYRPGRQSSVPDALPRPTNRGEGAPRKNDDWFSLIPFSKMDPLEVSNLSLCSLSPNLRSIWLSCSSCRRPPGATPPGHSIPTRLISAGYSPSPAFPHQSKST